MINLSALLAPSGSLIANTGPQNWTLTFWATNSSIKGNHSTHLLATCIPCKIVQDNALFDCCLPTTASLIQLSLSKKQPKNNFQSWVCPTTVDIANSKGLPAAGEWEGDFSSINGHKIKFLSRIWAQGLVKIMKLKLTRDFEAEDKSVFCCWSLTVVIKIILGRDSEATYGQDFEVYV